MISCYDDGMTAPEKSIKIRTLERHYRELAKAPAIARAALAESAHYGGETVESVVYKGYDDLIERFNGYCDQGQVYDELLPACIRLRSLLEGGTLPRIDDLSAKDLAVGVRESNQRMLEGQDNKRRQANGELVTQAQIDHAIGAPSVDTAPEALAVGVAGHIIERTIYAHLQKQGLETNTWAKDTVLWALEEIAMFRHIVAEIYGTIDDPRLTNYFIQPAGQDKLSGMGWRKQADLDAMKDTYQALEARLKAELCEAYETVVGDEIPDNITDQPFDDALAAVLSELYCQGLDETADELEALLGASPSL